MKLIAGPCSIESRDQLTQCVQQLSAIPQVELIRCGVWKPRTRPGGFEGLGEPALQWIKELRDINPSLRFCCEVARPEHVKLALQYGIETLWIGARTTANPFMVQELTEALRGTKTTILIKNAPSPDVKLWIGAIERCHQVGINDISAIHRGFDMYQNGSYRNNPLWQVPIELRRTMPEVPIICDPSHIAGCREFIRPLSQTALDLGFDGLMVEVHPSPSQALTDAQQQITPEQLQTLIKELIFRQSDSPEGANKLRILREQIDDIDNRLLNLLADRQLVSGQIAKVKALGNLAVFQPKRWDSVLNNRLHNAQKLGLSEQFIKELFEMIHAESVRIQHERISKQ